MVKIGHQQHRTQPEPRQTVATLGNVHLVLLDQILISDSLHHSVLLSLFGIRAEPSPRVDEGKGLLQILDLRSNFGRQIFWYLVIIEIHMLELDFLYSKLREFSQLIKYLLCRSMKHA